MIAMIRSLWKRYHAVALVYRIGAAFVLGSAVGLTVGEPATALTPLGDLFVRLLSMLVVPTIVFTLLSGLQQLRPETLGRIGGQVVAIYAVTSTIAVVIGLGVANLVDPGAGFELEEVAATPAAATPVEPPTLTEILLGVVPTNPFGAIADADIVAIIFFVVVFGLALLLVAERTESAAVRDGVTAIRNSSEAGAEAMFVIVWGVLEYGVVGVFALMASVFARVGADAILPFALLMVTLTAAVVLHVTVVYLLGIMMVFVHCSPLAFLNGSRTALVTALSSSSSSATLPVTMRNAQERLCVDKSVYGFSLPIGATINMDGTVMYQGIVAIFAANLAGVQLSVGKQIIVVFLAVLASIGTPGIPSAGLVMITLVLTQLGLPLEVVGFVAGVDPILDRLRTMVNVLGDLAVTVLVASVNDAIDMTGGAWNE